MEVVRAFPKNGNTFSQSTGVRPTEFSNAASPQEGRMYYVTRRDRTRVIALGSHHPTWSKMIPTCTGNRVGEISWGACRSAPTPGRRSLHS